MATLVVLTHALDFFVIPEDGGGYASEYLLWDVLGHLKGFGHHIHIVAGTKFTPGDAALLHVDCTIVPDDYLALGARYRRTINFATGDISKRRVSRFLLAPGDDWPGPVIVKHNLNCGGLMEQEHNRRAIWRGLPPPNPGVVHNADYRLFDRLADVPDALWADGYWVVERFMPERDGDNFVHRTWFFMGARESCTRLVTLRAISKAEEVIRRTPAPVPEQLRSERARLGFDYGKFDFVIHDGEPVLLDANHTPGIAEPLRGHVTSDARTFAQGLHALIEAP